MLEALELVWKIAANWWSFWVILHMAKAVTPTLRLRFPNTFKVSIWIAIIMMTAFYLGAIWIP